MKIVNVAKAIILNDKDQVLLLRRSATDTRRPGEWDFPGGWAEEGESFAIAASREVEEEAGIVIPVGDLKLVYTRTDAYPDRDENVNRLLFVAHAPTTDVKLSHEHDAHRWVDVPTALHDFQHPFYTEGLRHAQQHGLL